MERGLDLFWFGLNLDSELEKNVQALNQGVSEFKTKYSYV